MAGTIMAYGATPPLVVANIPAPSVEAGSSLVEMPFGQTLISGRNSAPVMNNDSEVPSILYAYCGNPYAGLLTGDADDVEVSAAFCIPLEDAQRYAGTRISSIIVASGLNKTTVSDNDITDVTVFVSDDLENGSYLVRKRGRLSRVALNWNEIKLDEPVEIKGDKALYVGATVIRASQNDLPFCTDGIPTNNGKSILLDYYLNGEHHKWEDWSATAGSICIKARIEGDALPTYDCEISNLSVPRQVAKDEPTEISFRLTNRGANDVTNALISIKIGDRKPFAIPLDNLPSALGYNAGVDLYWNMTNTDYGYDIPVTVKVEEVNGKPDTFEGNSSKTAKFVCMAPDQGFDRMMVMEEGTGTWCPNCPRGLLAMEYMAENHPDRFAGIGIHYSDRMAIDIRTPNYNPHLAMYKTYPNMRYNRVNSLGSTIGFNFSDEAEMAFDALTLLKAPCRIEIKDVYFTNDDKNELEVITSSEFTFSSSTDYGVSLVLVENGIGPYRQQNNYLGMGPQFGIFNEEEEPSVIFNHVARYITDYSGDPGFFPAEKEAGVKYTRDTQIPLLYKENLQLLENKVDFEVIALLINRETGEIENAAKMHCDGNLPVKPSGVAAVGNGAPVVSVSGNSIIISGAYASGNVCSVSGVSVAALAGETSVEVPSGLYIVEIDGVATKVVVR